jgi:protein MpaA
MRFFFLVVTFSTLVACSLRPIAKGDRTKDSSSKEAVQSVNPQNSQVSAEPSAAEATSRLAELRAAELQQVQRLCDRMDALYKRNKWGRPPACDAERYQVFGTSVEGWPLVVFETGDPRSAKLTLVQCAIHGDELPALPMCLRMIEEIKQGTRGPPTGTRLMVQPLLNPDGMFRAKPTRQNSRGVDLNRNFPTSDWDRDAHKSWTTRDKKDPRKFPGVAPNTEPETQAIVEFLKTHRPQKIISIHTPLGFLDLDTKGDDQKVRRAKYLAVNMSKNAGDFRFRSWGFFPGSLGNFAGREMQIPVYTLELPPGESRPTVDGYWKRFRPALWRAVDFDLDTGLFHED